MADANVIENAPVAKLAAEYLECCSDAFGNLAAILKSIVKETPEHSDIRKLAGAGLMIRETLIYSPQPAPCRRESATIAQTSSD